MKKIEIDLITLLAIILIIVGLISLFIFTISSQEQKCIYDPIDYSNNHYQEYGWDYVVPIKIYGKKD